MTNVALKAAKLSTHLADLSRQKAVLQDKLARALLLQAFEPRAFTQGKPCRVGGSGSFAIRGQVPKVIIHLSTGEDVTHDALDVPFDLWPPTLQDDYLAVPQKQRPKLRSTMSLNPES